MSDSFHQSTLTRLLTLNNQVHDLENQMMGVGVGVDLGWGESGEGPRSEASSVSAIAEIQEEIDRGVRASLATCWLELPVDLDD